MWIPLAIVLLGGSDPTATTQPAMATTISPLIDSSGVGKFWAAVDLLSKDESVCAEQWDALFGAPGYRDLEQERYGQKARIDQIEHAFRPSLRETDMDSSLEDGDFSRTIAHLRLANSRREEITKFIERFSSESPLERAVAAAQKYLPAGVADPAEPPPLRLVVLYPGGRALNDAVVFDACLLSFASAPHTWIGHELHHVYRRKLDKVRHEAVTPDDSPLLAILTRMEMDGVADLIDKRDVVNRAADAPAPETAHPVLKFIFENYRSLQRQAPGIIRMIDASLSSLGDQPADSKRIGDQLGVTLPWMAKQAVGMFMADAIEKHLGRDRLITTVGNPFAFFILYDEAARIAGDEAALPRLSSKAIDALRTLHTKYIGKSATDSKSPNRE